MSELITVFKCPCEGFKYKLAGNRYNPTLKEKREMGELISIGCTVLKIPISQFREEKWTWCSKHFETKKKINHDQKS